MEAEEIADVIKKTIEAELGSYKIPKQQHYAHHLWIDKLIVWQDRIQNGFCKAIIGIIVSAMAALFLLGFLFFGKVNFK